MTMRHIQSISVAGITPQKVSDFRPEFRDVEPTELLVDAAYQRNLTERSVTLIRKIVAEWSWSAFKPPITVDVDGELHVVDGQHTATAAASHPGIGTIPVVVVPAEEQGARASAFVRHNRDRVNVTPMQLHYSLLAAGDEEAQDAQNVCDRAGVKILRNPPSMGRFKPGETLAIVAIKSVIKRRYVSGARRVLEICVGAQLSPVDSDSIKAVDSILFDGDYKGKVEPGALTNTIRTISPQMRADVAAFSAAHKVPRWRALAVILFKNTRKIRGAK